MRTIPALKFALLLALGIWIGDLIPSLPLLPSAILAFLLMLLGLAGLERTWGVAPVFAVAVFTGLLLGQSSRFQPVVGVEPSLLSGKIISRVYSRDDRQACLIRLSSLSPLGKGSTSTADQKVTLIKKVGWEGSVLRLITPSDSTLQPGTELLLAAQVNPYPDQRNLGGRNWRRDFLRQGISGWVKPDTFIVIHAGSPGWRQTLRGKFSRILGASLPPRQADLAAGMILGDRGLLPETLNDDFRRSGLYHLLVVSGSNIGYLLAVLALLIGVFSPPLRLRRLVMIAGIWAYAALTGLEPPALRAALMITLVLLSYEVRCVPRPWNGLGAAALIILIFDPQQLFQPGFQLSFAAMAGVLFAADLKSRRDLALPALPVKSRKVRRFVNRWLYLPLIAGLCTVAFTAPILIAHFGGYAPAAVVWNLPAIPLTGAIFSLSWLVILLKGFLGVSVAALNSGLELSLKGLETLAAWGSHLPGNASGHYGGMAVAIVLVAALGGFFLVRKKQRKLLWAGGGLAVILLLPLGQAATPYFEVELLDVGQGDATLMRFPDGQCVLVDAGTEEAARFELVPALKHQGITRLSDLVISHFDRDHSAGSLVVMQELKVDRLLVNELEPQDELGRSIIKEARSRHIPIRVLALGDTLGGLPGTRCLTLWPPRNLHAKDDNDESLVLRVSYGQTDVLFTGDLPARKEKALLKAGVYLQSEILKVAHHGSSRSSSRAFLDAVHPQFALIGVGRNRYGHPTARVLADLKAEGARIHRTDRDGAGLWRSDGKTVWEVDWK